jgi:hypothetical protein
MSRRTGSSSPDAAGWLGRRLTNPVARTEIGASIRGFEDRLRAARPEVRYISVEPVPAE